MPKTTTEKKRASATFANNNKRKKWANKGANSMLKDFYPWPKKEKLPRNDIDKTSPDETDAYQVPSWAK